MFKRFRVNSALDRLVEERLFEIVADEMESNSLRKGLWAKAFSQSGGNSDIAKSKYIGLRVDSLKDETTLLNAIVEELEGKLKKTNEPEYEERENEIKHEEPENEVADLLKNTLITTMLIIILIAVITSASTA